MVYAISANTFTAICSVKHKSNHKFIQNHKKFLNLFRLSAADEASDCNTEECAPEKEVGKLNMGWVAEENTKVIGTFPPRTTTRGFTGYVEKDTAGQTNIYSVEPVVYVAESAVSSGAAGSSADGSENTAAVSFGLALIALAAATSIVIQVGKNPQLPVQTQEYSGPSLSYYINKFKVTEVITEASTLSTETQPSPVTDLPEPSESTEIQASSVADLPEASSVTDLPEASVPDVSPDQVEVISEPEVSVQSP